MTRTLLATLAIVPLLAVPALAVTAVPKVKVPVAQHCVGETPADCATIHKVPRIKSR